ncbi:chitotriosidase-1 [Nannizzia gypsea CBS 118893]|uniref:chitinase n=1 Tax=Arthroderma gypseum (strain ATCC MYA-4604 / CBS 118893) TaxID=535722 RepID=E4V2F9_ARTGP|nr:chitotriosidase-1 [Nannizzia gypsea CBS 118893]EFR04224.1 chitotriosidase-1 [Nannizzia gypsea CBS 118893]
MNPCKPSFLVFSLLYTSTLFGFASPSPAVGSDDKSPSGIKEYICTATRKCKLGCCGPLDRKGNGVCGLGPKFCGPGCTSSCDSKSECDPGWGKKWSSSEKRPLNVCCSKFGFCGTTPEFCGGAVVTSPNCGNSKTAYSRIIGYYEVMKPEDIPLGYYTHINFAFALIDPHTFRIAPIDPQTGSLYQRVTALKDRQSDLEVWIAIGGWAMNDPGPTRTTFSDLAAFKSRQDAFFESLITFMLNNGFDGVDIDWEYPVADDRAGKPEDFKNFVTFLRRLRQRLNQTGRKFGLTITLPASYWYLRGFDIVNLEPHVDWFNVMTYDIHRTWDAGVTSIGSYAYAHTNLTEINMALQILWRNNINPARVVMGLGFYGRSFTMKDRNCLDPGCEFKSGARGGECTGTSGVLSAGEIKKVISQGASIKMNSEAAAKIITWDNDQWVSWDDEQTLKIKMDYANQRCLGGIMVWAIDLDDGTLIDALGAAMNKTKMEVFEGSQSFIGSDLGTIWPGKEEL